MLKVDKQPIINNRVRKINGSFSFIPHDFVTKGFLAALNQHELLLYFLLVTVGDPEHAPGPLNRVGYRPGCAPGTQDQNSFPG